MTVCVCVSAVVVSLVVVGQFRPPEIRRFTSTIQTLRRSPRTELCNPNFGPRKCRLLVSLQTREPSFFGRGWPIPAARNSAFHQYDSNGPKIVSNGALYPKFWTPPIFNFLCLCSTQKQHLSSVFSFSAIFRPNGLGRPPQTLTFQYRTTRSRPVIPSPRSFPAEKVFLTYCLEW